MDYTLPPAAQHQKTFPASTGRALAGAVFVGLAGSKKTAEVLTADEWAAQAKRTLDGFGEDTVFLKVPSAEERYRYTTRAAWCFFESFGFHSGSKAQRSFFSLAKSYASTKLVSPQQIERAAKACLDT